jgi:hypothetical protein
LFTLLALSEKKEEKSKETGRVEGVTQGGQGANGGRKYGWVKSSRDRYHGWLCAVNKKQTNLLVTQLQNLLLSSFLPSFLPLFIPLLTTLDRYPPSTIHHPPSTSN